MCVCEAECLYKFIHVYTASLESSFSKLFIVLSFCLCHFFVFSFYLPFLVPAENVNLVKSGLKCLQEPMNDCRYSLIKFTHSFNSLIALLMYVHNVYCTVGIHILFSVYMPSIYNSRRGFKYKSSTSRSTSIF